MKCNEDDNDEEDEDFANLGYSTQTFCACCSGCIHIIPIATGFG